MLLVNFWAQKITIQFSTQNKKFIIIIIIIAKDMNK